MNNCQCIKHRQLTDSCTVFWSGKYLLVVVVERGLSTQIKLELSRSIQLAFRIEMMAGKNARLEPPGSQKEGKTPANILV